MFLCDVAPCMTMDSDALLGSSEIFLERGISQECPEGSGASQGHHRHTRLAGQASCTHLQYGPPVELKLLMRGLLSLIVFSSYCMQRRDSGGM